MDAKFVKKFKVLTSMCDNTKRLSIPYTFSLFMDLAAEHGTDIGVGADDLAKKGLFWLTTKTKIIFHSRPEMMETITAELTANPKILVIAEGGQKAGFEDAYTALDTQFGVPGTYCPFGGTLAD